MALGAAALQPIVAAAIAQLQAEGGPLGVSSEETWKTVSVGLRVQDSAFSAVYDYSILDDKSMESRLS